MDKVKKSRFRQSLQHGFAVINYLFDQFIEDECGFRAAALTYTTLLSIVPIMMVGFYILSLFPIFHGIAAQIKTFVINNFVADSANIVAQHLDEFLVQLQKLSLLNLFFLLFVSILMILNMVTAFNAIWHVKMRRHLVFYLTIYLLLVLITPVLFAFLLILTTHLASLPFLKTIHENTTLSITSFARILPYLASFITFTFLNWLLPSTKVRFIHAVIAGFFTMVLFELAKFFFVLYLNYFPTYRLLYGALATIPIFLVWIYLSWTIILIGALLCRFLATGLPKSYYNP